MGAFSEGTQGQTVRWHQKTVTSLLGLGESFPVEPSSLPLDLRVKHIKAGIEASAREKKKHTAWAGLGIFSLSLLLLSDPQGPEQQGPPELWQQLEPPEGSHAQLLGFWC